MIGSVAGRGARFTAAFCLALSVLAADGAYRSATIDVQGQLHILLRSGKEILPKKSKGQVSFSQPLVTGDSRTVGWLVEYQDPLAVGYSYPIAGALVLYRGGHILHTFTTDQVFWDWQFSIDEKQVAYSTGPTHGGAAECVLRDVESGKVVDRWVVTSGSEPPAWAESLRR